MTVDETIRLGGLKATLDNSGKSEAFYAQGPLKTVGPDAVAALKERLKDKPGGQVRVCLHESPAANGSQDMLIVLGAAHHSKTHKHLNKEETYHIVEGRLRLELYDAQGKKTSTLTLGAPGSGLPFMARIPRDTWHATFPEGGFAVFHESRPGPFEPGDNQYAPWESGR